MIRYAMPLLAALTSGAMLCAAPPEIPVMNAGKTPSRAQREARKGPRMEPPVYEQNSAPEAGPQNARAMTAEERAKFSAMRQRRFEIMVLIHAYKIMPEAQRAPLKAELMRRIQEDLEVSLAKRQAKISAAEKELARLRQELADQEAHKAELVAKEMERLLKVQPPKPHEGRPEDGPADVPPPDAPKRQ